MKHRFYYAVFEQERESVNETWEEAYDPEPYDIFPSLKEAREVKKQLVETNHNPLVRWFIEKDEPVDMILNTRANNRGMGGDYV